MEKRIAYFDIAKGIAIITVIVGHLGGLPDLIHRIIFSFHMPLFFLISGYFMKKMNEDAFLQKKTRDILFPYIITSAAIIVLVIIKGICLGESFTEIITQCTKWIWAAFYGSGNNYTEPIYIKQIGAIWFLLALFFATLIVNWVLKYKNSTLIIISIVLAGYYSSKIFWLPFSIQAGMVASGFVYIGFIARQYNVLNRIQTTPSITAMCLSIWLIGIACGCGKLYMVRNTYNLGIWEVVVSISAAVVILAIAHFLERIKTLSKGFSWLGKNSLYILCLHLVELNIFPWGIVREYFETTYDIGHFFFVAMVLKLFWTVGGTYVILWIKKHISSYKLYNIQNDIQNNLVKSRIEWIDAVKGLAIILMVLGHLPIDSLIRTMIFSWHMPIFILLSGYLFTNKKLSIIMKRKIKGLLIPYLLTESVAAAIAMWRLVFYSDFTIAGGIDLLKSYFISAVLGISYASKIFVNVKSVGPIWFVTCLFITNIIMTVILQTTNDNEWKNCCMVIATTLLGYFIGKKVAFLPHSIDVAMFSIVFFYFGYIMKKYCLLSKLKTVNSWFFIMIVWLVAVYLGGIELAIRKYPMFPICILGGIAGSLIVIELCKQLIQIEFIRDVLCFCGRYSIWILGVHRLEMEFCPWGKIVVGTNIYIYFILRIVMIISILMLCLAAKKNIESARRMFTGISIKNMLLQKQ